MLTDTTTQLITLAAIPFSVHQKAKALFKTQFVKGWIGKLGFKFLAIAPIFMLFSMSVVALSITS